MWLLYISVLLFYITTADSSMYENIKENILSLVGRSNYRRNNNDSSLNTNAVGNFHQTDGFYTKQAKDEANSMMENHKKQNITTSEFISGPNVGTEHPWLQQRSKPRVIYRREYKYGDIKASEETDRDFSTSLEMAQWKDDFDIDWVSKKAKAIEEHTKTGGMGEVFNIAAGRPWAIPCGDPNQHDLPWGTCTLTMECDAEYRIYRGDDICGRTHFVCCALQLTQHDMYQAVDLSFIETSFSTDSNEKRKADRGSVRNKRRKSYRDRMRRKQRRLSQKRKIKRSIRKLARQIRTSLNRAFRNATADRRQKTQALKEQIKRMKKKFRNERQAAKNVHDFDLEAIHDKLADTLSHVKDLNKHFLMNDTFRHSILNNNTDMNAARELLSVYPELASYFPNDTEQPDLPKTRRSGGGRMRKRKKSKLKDYLEYDIEYGALYF